MAPIAFSRRLLGVGLLALCVTVLTGCQSAPKVLDPMRAVWVTRSDYRTADDIDRVMDNCDPGYDPLAVAVHEAHRRGLALHAWVNVMPAWSGDGPPPIRNQLYHTRPHWFWYDATGKRQPITHRVGDRTRNWYVSLNPCLPEVRQYLVAVMREIVANYPVDGLHLDYIRFPNEAVVPGEQVPDYPRDRRTLAPLSPRCRRHPGSPPRRLEPIGAPRRSPNWSPRSKGWCATRIPAPCCRRRRARCASGPCTISRTRGPGWSAATSTRCS
jgi:uncharacterized lipoprotein YddW (UPF0748 family)